MFPVRYFCDGYFAPRYFVKAATVLIVQTAESLHYVLPESRCHYKFALGKANFTLAENRPHYRLAKDN